MIITDIYNPGEKIENEFLIEKIRNKINEMLNWKKQTFPGSNPVSLSNYNIKLLFKNDYIICEKTDGIRYFLFIASNTTFFIDRNYDIYKNDIHIPTKDDLNKHQQLTLLDGELVEDIIYNKEKNIEEKKIVYLIYDALYIERTDITNLNYLDRLTNIYNYVITPLKEYKKLQLLEKKKNKQKINNNNLNNIILSKLNDNDTLNNNNLNNNDNINSNDNINNNDNKDNTNYNKIFPNKKQKLNEYNNIKENIDNIDSDISESNISNNSLDENSPFEIYLKDFYNKYQIEVLIKIMKKLPHYSDGIIFTPLYSSYVTGNCHNLFKWKPSNLNTIDFGIEIIYEYNIPANFELFISINGVRTSYKYYLSPYGEMYKKLLEISLNTDISQYIVECFYISKNIYSIRINNDLTKSKIEGGWIAQKIRYDKTLPNDIKTVNKVVQSIRDNIDLDTLTKEIIRNKKK